MNYLQVYTDDIHCISECLLILESTSYEGLYVYNFLCMRVTRTNIRKLLIIHYLKIIGIYWFYSIKIHPIISDHTLALRFPCLRLESFGRKTLQW